MTRRSRIWLVVAVLFSLVNLAGGVYAAAEGEPLHAGIHVVLLLFGVALVRRLAAGRDARRIWRRKGSVTPAQPELTDRLTHLEQSVDAVAIEIERIGEGQRFMTRFFSEKGPQRAATEGAAEPVEIDAPEAGPNVRRY
jgi:hypothetical protein